MVESYLRQSPLAHLGLAGRPHHKGMVPGVTLSESPFRGIVNLRGKPDDKAFLAAAQLALGVGLPLEPNSKAISGQARVLWLSPEEWWIVTPGEGPELADKLRQALAGQLFAVTDVSESRTCIRVGGPSALDLLAKGCPLDLHPKVFTERHCAQSLLAKANVVLDRVAGAEDDQGVQVEVYVLRSFADYLWRWLEDAAREFGLAIV